MGAAAALEALSRQGRLIAVSGESRVRLENHLARLGYRWRFVRGWRLLHTGSTGLGLPRRSANMEDLRQAFAARSLEGLKETFAILGGMDGENA